MSGRCIVCACMCMWLCVYMSIQRAGSSSWNVTLGILENKPVVSQSKALPSGLVARWPSSYSHADQSWEKSGIVRNTAKQGLASPCCFGNQEQWNPPPPHRHSLLEKWRDKHGGPEARVTEEEYSTVWRVWDTPSGGREQTLSTWSRSRIIICAGWIQCISQQQTEGPSRDSATRWPCQKHISESVSNCWAIIHQYICRR